MKMQVIEKGTVKTGQPVRHQRYGAGTILSLFASYALVEFDRPFSEKTVPMDQLYYTIQEERENDQ